MIAPIFDKKADLPRCVNCSKSDWVKDKKGNNVCVYCGHKVVYTKEQINFSNKLSKLIERNGGQ